MTGTDDRLDEIEQRAVATDGPWSASAIFPQDGSPEFYSLWDDGVGREVATIERRADAEFIAHAREDVPWLIRELRDARAEIARLHEQGDFELIDQLDRQAAEIRDLRSELDDERAKVEQALTKIGEVAEWSPYHTRDAGACYLVESVTDLVDEARAILRGDDDE